MMRTTLAEVARLDDSRLETLIRDAIDEAQRRPAMRPGLIQLLAGVLGEIKAERLVRLPISAEEICKLAEVRL